VLEAAAVRSIAKNLAGIVNGHRIRRDESGVGGDQRIEVDQRAVTNDKGNMLARNGRVVAPLWKEGGADDLGRQIDSGRLGP